MSAQPQIVVLGAGVLGLTTALQLARKGYERVSIIAKHLPGDDHADYSSIWAGADYVPVSKPDSEEAQWDREAWHELAELANSRPEAGVWFQDRTGYYRNEDRTRESFDIWWKDLVHGFRFLSSDELPDFADWGTFYRTISLDPGVYLHYLQSQCLSLGVTIRRAAVDHIRDAFVVTTLGIIPNNDDDDAATRARADVVVNCSGLWASSLGGVMDEHMVPVRGQLVLVENESGGIFFCSGDGDMDRAVGECSYIINRPGGRGTALGGSSHVSWDRAPDPRLAERIMQRSIKICPQLVPAGSGIEALRVIRHQVGLRPVRTGGARVEGEVLQDDDSGGRLRLVHCYGAAGFGFQSSYGMANKAARLVDDAVAGLAE